MLRENYSHPSIFARIKNCKDQNWSFPLSLIDMQVTAGDIASLIAEEGSSLLKELYLSYSRVGNTEEHKGYQPADDADPFDEPVYDNVMIALLDHCRILKRLIFNNNIFLSSKAWNHIERLRYLESLEVQACGIEDPLIIINFCETLIRNGNENDIDVSKLAIDVSQNPVKWDGVGEVSASILAETNPKQLKEQLLKVRESKMRTATARIVTAGKSGVGKTHLRRRLTEVDANLLSSPLERTHVEDGLWTTGAVVKEVVLTQQQHGRDRLPAISLVLVDVGGHREQLHAHHNFIYLSGQSIFLLCTKAKDMLDEWARYYLEMIQDLTIVQYSNKNQKSVEVGDLSGLLRLDQKASVIIIPTHRDQCESLPELPEIDRLRQYYPLLNISVVPPINNLSSHAAIEVRKHMGMHIEHLPQARSIVLEYIDPIRKRISDLFSFRHDSNHWSGLSSITIEALKDICKGFNADDFEYTIRELLRLGDIVIPLQQSPREIQLAEERIESIVNPHFVNYFLYGILMDSDIRRNNGFMTDRRFDELTASLDPSDRRVLQDLLLDYMVFFRWEGSRRVEGMFIPDHFSPRPNDVFSPWTDASFDVTAISRRFIAEHIFFKFISRHKKLLEPIDASRSQYIYRDACAMSNENVKAQIYCNVLDRSLRVCVKGEAKAAEIFGNHLISSFEDSLGRPFDIRNDMDFTNKGGSMRILFLAANPVATSRLELDEELRSLEAEIRQVEYRKQVTLVARHAVRPDDIIREIREVSPNVIHFSGHASSDGIVLLDDFRNPFVVNGEVLRRFLNGRGVQLVFFNACSTATYCQSISEVVDAVVGTTDSVGDEAARRFAVAFYRSLGNGLAVKEAYRDGGDAVALHGLDDVFTATGDLNLVMVGTVHEKE